ncbi:hypothetical protein Tco_0514951 [Tanacetum coccineum]
MGRWEVVRGRLGRCTREVVWPRNCGKEAVWVWREGGYSTGPNKVQVGFVCTMAEIGCNWARIGPSKSSQSLSIAHKWAVIEKVPQGLSNTWWKEVCWSAKKKSLVAMSSVEAEYVATARCHAQVLWIKSQLVAKLSLVRKETLILPSGGVNVDETADKSLFGTVVQLIVRESCPLKQVAETQHIEEPMATSNATKVIENSKLGEELNLLMPKRNDTFRFIMPNVDPKNSRLCKDPQHPTHESLTFECLNFTQPHGLLNHNKKSPKVHEKIVEEAIKDSWITLVGNVPFKELYGHDTNMDADESPFDTKSEIKFIGKEKVVQKKHDDCVKTTQIGCIIDLEMQKVDSDLESMPDDEILSVSRFKEADDDDFENAKDLSLTNEVGADNVVDELVDMANTQDANLNIFAAKETNSDPLGHIQADITSLTAKVIHLESSLSQQVANKTNDSVPRMVADVF